MGGPEVEALLSHLVSQRDVAAATRQQALSVLLFPYREVLGVELPLLDQVVRPKKPKRLPTVLNRDEVMRILTSMEGRHGQVGVIPGQYELMESEQSVFRFLCEAGVRNLPAFAEASNLSCRPSTASALA